MAKLYDADSFRLRLQKSCIQIRINKLYVSMVDFHFTSFFVITDDGTW